MIVAGQGPTYERVSALGKYQMVPAGQPIPDCGDVLLSVQYDRIITQDQIDGYEQVLNLHFGPLPQLRGCFPTKWAIINNEPAGVSFHHIDAGIDTGPVVDVVRFDVSELTDQQVYERCNEVAFKLFVKWVRYLEQGIVPKGIPQDESEAKYYTRELPFAGVRPEGCPPDFAERLERAFTHPPYPPLQSNGYTPEDIAGLVR